MEFLSQMREIIDQNMCVLGRGKHIETNEVYVAYAYRVFEDSKILRVVLDNSFLDCKMDEIDNLDHCEGFLDFDFEGISYHFCYSNIVQKSKVESIMFEYSETFKGLEINSEDLDEKKIDSIKKKIKKSLNLAQNNPSVEEAYSALLMAQRMMYQYSLSEEVGSDADGYSSVVKNAVNRVVEPYGKFEEWKLNLVNVISKNFRCFAYYVGRSSAKAQFHVGGLEDDVEIVAFNYEFARNVAIESARKYLNDYKIKEKRDKRVALFNYIGECGELGIEPDDEAFNILYDSIHKFDYKDIERNFYNGFVKGLKTKFEEQVESMALVLVVDEVVSDLEESYKIKEYTTSSKSQVKRNHAESYQKGFERGNSLTAHNEIGD